MNTENLLEEAELDEKWDRECPEFPNKIFSYENWKFKKIGHIREAQHVSKIRYKPSLLPSLSSFCSPKNHSTKIYISVKQLDLPTGSRQARNLLYEIKSLMMLEERNMNERREINIIKLFGYRKEEGCYQLYMEWMDFSLKDFYMKGVKDMLVRRTLTEEIRSKLNTLMGYITVEIIDALCELVTCERSIIHRDVKPENILLSYTGNVKLADFGEARFENTRTTGGTPRYRPPEAFRMREIGEDDLRKYDVFSLGVVILEYFCGMHPYDYIMGNSQSRYLNDAVLAEEGELTKWSDNDSVFTENRLIEDNNFREFLTLSLRHIETRATPLELQQTHFYTVYKVPNSRTGVATILNELEIHPEPVIISQRQSTKPLRLPFIVFGFVLMAIFLFILAAMFLYIPPITECENIGGTCLNNETGCDGADRMIMPFSCSPKQPNAKCCVDAKEKAKIDSQKWQNNCSCDLDKILGDSVCIDEVPPGTKKLEEELNANFKHLIRTFSNFNVCEPETPQMFKVKRAISVHIFSGLGKEKKRAVEKFIYAYLVYIVTEKTPCSTGIEEMIHWEIVDEHTKAMHRWYANLTTPVTTYDHPYTSHITIILNSCGSKNWGSADIGPL